MKLMIYLSILFLPLIIYGKDIALEDFLEQFHSHYPHIETLKVNFVQTKHSPMFLDPIQAGGTFYYQVNEQETPFLRWEYSPPYEGWGLIRENKYYSYTKVLNQLEVYSFEQYRHYQELLGALDFSEDKLNALINDRYTLMITAADTEYKMEIHPNEDPSPFKVIYFYFQKEDLEPLRLEYHEDKEDFVRFRFQEMKVNPDLSDNIFKVNVPEEATIITEEEIQKMLR